MNLEIFKRLFSGSPFKLLSDHRVVVLESLKHLNKQLTGIYVLKQPCQEIPIWIVDLPRNLEQVEQDILLSLQKPSLTAMPKEVVNTFLQTQNNIAHQVCRISERISCRTIQMTEEQQLTMGCLCNNFSRLVYQLVSGAVKLDALEDKGYRKQHFQLLQEVRKQLDFYIEELRKDSSDLKTQVCHQESLMAPMDAALLFMTLDDIGDLAFWVRSMAVQL